MMNKLLADLNTTIKLFRYYNNEKFNELEMSNNTQNE